MKYPLSSIRLYQYSSDLTRVYTAMVVLMSVFGCKSKAKPASDAVSDGEYGDKNSFAARGYFSRKSFASGSMRFVLSW